MYEAHTAHPASCIHVNPLQVLLRQYVAWVLFPEISVDGSKCFFMVWSCAKTEGNIWLAKKCKLNPVLGQVRKIQPYNERKQWWLPMCQNLFAFVLCWPRMKPSEWGPYRCVSWLFWQLRPPRKCKTSSKANTAPWQRRVQPKLSILWAIKWCDMPCWLYEKKHWCWLDVSMEDSSHHAHWWQQITREQSQNHHA